MHFYISIVLALAALVLIFAKDKVLDKTSDNQTLKMVYDNSMMIGAGFAGAAGYIMYTHQTAKVNNVVLSESPTPSTSETE